MPIIKVEDPEGNIHNVDCGLSTPLKNIVAYVAGRLGVDSIILEITRVGVRYSPCFPTYVNELEVCSKDALGNPIIFYRDLKLSLK